MKKRFLIPAAALLCALLFGAPAHAQDPVTLTATNIQDVSGRKLASGSLCVQGTDDKGNVIAFRAGSGGQVISTPICTPIVNGAIGTFTVPNSDSTVPVGVLYHITVQPRPSRPGQSALVDLPLVYINASPFNLDSYNPPGTVATPYYVIPFLKGTWSSGTTYAVNEGVSYSGSGYVSIVSGNLNHQPDSSPSYWRLLVSKGDTGSTGSTGATGATGACTVAGDSCFIKPPAVGSNGTACWATYWGSDSNDGRSIGSAKESIMACYDLFYSAGYGGDIYVMDGGGPAYPVKATQTAGEGIWICGSTDSACFASPPTGWRKGIAGSAVHIIGVGPNGKASIAAGSQADNWHPAIWYSGSAATATVENLAYQYPNVGVIVGCTAAHDCSAPAGGTSGLTLRGINGHINQVAGAGPNVRIGSNSFWVNIFSSSFSGNAAEKVTIATIARSSNVATVTTDSAFTVTQYQHAGIMNATDNSFNTSFAIATVTDSTHFTFASIGPDVSATDFGGILITDKSIPIVEDPWNGNTQGTGSGLVRVEGIDGGSFYSEGGVRLWPGSGGGGIYVRDITVEGSGTPVAPGVWVAASVTAQVVRVSNIEMADTGGQTAALRTDIIDGTSPRIVSDQIQASGLASEGEDPALGPMTGICNQWQPSSTRAWLRSPNSQGQACFGKGIVWGQVNAARRMWGFTGTPYGLANVANTDPTTWTTAGGTLTTGIAFADGTTGAGQLAGSGGNLIVDGPHYSSLTVGDAFLLGAWVKSSTANGFQGGAAFRFDTNASGYGSGNVCEESRAAQISATQISAGDGQWSYYWTICYVTKYGGNEADTQLVFQSSSTNTVQVYAPKIFYVPAGTASRNDLYETVINLGNLTKNCPAIGICAMPGQKLGLPGSTEFVGLETHANTANRTYTNVNSDVTRSGTICQNVTPVTVAANTTSDQNLMACSLNSNALNTVGRTIRVTSAGVYSTVATYAGTVTYKVKLCTVSGCGSGTVITLATWTTAALGSVTVANDPYGATLVSTTQTAGASSAHEAHGKLEIGLTATATDAIASYRDGNTATVGTISSSVALFLQTTVAFSSGSSSNSVTERQQTVEIIN